MEALLKLIVGVDGVTAEMLISLAYLYVAGQAITTLGFVTGFLGLATIITRCIRYNIDKISEVSKARIEKGLTSSR